MLEKERSFFDSNREKWLKDFPGKFALVKGTELVGAFETQEGALAEGARRFGLQPFLVRRIDGMREPVYVPALALGILRADSQHSVRR